MWLGRIFPTLPCARKPLHQNFVLALFLPILDSTELFVFFLGLNQIFLKLHKVPYSDLLDFGLIVSAIWVELRDQDDINLIFLNDFWLLIRFRRRVTHFCKESHRLIFELLFHLLEPILIIILIWPRDEADGLFSPRRTHFWWFLEERIWKYRFMGRRWTIILLLDRRHLSLGSWNVEFLGMTFKTSIHNDPFIFLNFLLVRNGVF